MCSLRFRHRLRVSKINILKTERLVRCKSLHGEVSNHAEHEFETHVLTLTPGLRFISLGDSLSLKAHSIYKYILLAHNHCIFNKVT